MHKQVIDALEQFEQATDAHFQTGMALRMAREELKVAIHAHGPPACLEVNTSRLRAYIRTEERDAARRLTRRKVTPI